MTRDTVEQARPLLAQRLGAQADAGVIDLLLLEAVMTLLSLTHREELPTGMAGLLARLAAVYYNRMGAEGESRRREGSVQVETPGVPEDIQREIRAWRLAWVEQCIG